MPVRIAICDDNSNLCEHLLRLVKKQCSHCVADVYRSGGTLLRVNKAYDIYLLDVQMPGLSGLQVAERIRDQQAGSEPESIIIFVTALKEYMEQAFDVRAFHYLVKPVDEGKFSTVFNRALEDFERRAEASGQHMMIKSGSAYHKIFLHDILYIESSDKKNIIHTIHGPKTYYGKLQELENTLPRSFFRCHRSFIVNMEHIEKYNAEAIALTGGETVYIAQKKYPAFVRAYMLFARDGLFHE